MDKSDNFVTSVENLVELIRKPNKDLVTETLVGVDINKNLIEEKVKGKKTDLKKLQVVEKGCFVMSGMSVGRDKRVPVALYMGEKPLGASSSNKYYVFKVKNPNLKAEYLNLIFKTAKIDLMGIYFSGQGCRGELAWKNFSQILISIPPLEKQERIVNKYKTVTQYIDLKKRINELFEKQMTAYYHVLFDDLTDYTVRNFGELFTVIRGGRPPRGNKEQESKYFCKGGGIPWLQVRDISKNKYKFIDKTSEQLTQEGFRKGRCTMFRGGHVIFRNNGNVDAIRKITISFNNMCADCVFISLKAKDRIGLPLLFYLLQENIESILRKSAASANTKTVRKGELTMHPIKLPPQPLTDKFNSFCEPIFELQKRNEQIIKKLLRIQKCWIESLD